MKKIILSVAIAIMAGGATSAFAQTPVKKTADKKTATAPKKSEDKTTDKTAKVTGTLSEQEEAEMKAYEEKEVARRNAVAKKGKEMQQQMEQETKDNESK